MGLSSPNFRPNSATNGASIYGANAKTGAKNPKLKLKENRVEGEIVDVDYRSVSANETDSFQTNRNNYANLAYRNSVYAKVEEQRKGLEEQKQKDANKEKFANQTATDWEAKINQARESVNEKDVEKDLAKKLDLIDKRLANIEEALGINGGVKNFQPSSLPQSAEQTMASNPNSNYQRHVSDYSSLVKGMQELHRFKRDMGTA